MKVKIDNDIEEVIVKNMEVVFKILTDSIEKIRVPKLRETLTKIENIFQTQLEKVKIDFQKIKDKTKVGQ